MGRALVVPLAVFLAIVGIGFCAFDVLLVRPDMRSFAWTGRREMGTVLITHSTVKAVVPRHSRWTIAVNDPELGAQLVDGDGAVGARGHVDVLCSTPARRCERMSLVDAYVESWPFTPNMERSAALIAAAAVLAGIARWRRAPDATPTPDL